MRILCIGDIVGKPGRRVLADCLKGFTREQSIDVVIANAENAAGGSGLTPQMFDKLRRYGVHGVTMGDHVYRRAEICQTLATSDRIVRPANLPAEAAGRALTAFEQDGRRVAMFSLLGRMFMKMPVDCPFHAADAVLAQVPEDVKVVVCDLHAEATGEKLALARHLAGRVSVVFGTHTHVPTADEQILAGHTAYITDVGMTGPYDSILGRQVKPVLAASITGMPHPFDVADGDVRMCGIVADVDDSTGAATAVQRVRVDLPPDSGEIGDGEGDDGGA
ncbi:MAG: 2',3'-cyclic-nucleotide 2'-phosphodiesterase [Phycisphaerae bacterium]|nr:2',3'-cyclic-nucleotide 2'-phosphodiesterase [Phycisphaerae bacterium]